MSAPQSVSPRRRSRLLSASSWFVALALVLTPALAGCDQASAKKTVSSEATTAQTTIEVPDVVGLKGDAAVDALEKAGLTEDPTFKDVDGKESVWKKSNWSVTAQDPAAGEQVAADREITLTVTHDSAHAEASAKASASAAAAAEASASAAAAAEAAEKAAQEAQQAEEAAQEQAQEPEEPAQPAQKPQAYYRNCAEAKAAGAAPLYQGDPGYRSALDRDHDGVACEK
ncbi:excalibur calcium-binding domain-containing protein [uncultured Actinomyces sp.]|uniref:excalibur calcium-binding domain-containing protein n=1 Tax=uncultured Actinomyces sp. TaxID=249061 RepID=UPI0028E28A7B|nr:excalibur calcium-binding domain-containing protein [uncultured Actinomyces sp.]